MGCDMVVALGRATVDGRTLFGQNTLLPTDTFSVLCSTRARSWAQGEKVRTQHLEIPQCRETGTVLGNRPAGIWGYDLGLNEHGVIAGCAWLPHSPRLEPTVGLIAPDLVRLALERARSARQAIDLLTDLIRDHGQGQADQGDASLLIADSQEAFALETAGAWWAYQEVHQVRAVGNARVIHQDWDRIRPGFSGLAIEHKWWPDDGRKLDVASALDPESLGVRGAMRRWGKATFALEQQNGKLDPASLRWLLAEHHEIARDERALAGTTTVSRVIEVGGAPERPPLMWSAFGPPRLAIYLPAFLTGEIPVSLSGADTGYGEPSLRHRLAHLPEHRADLQERISRLQETIDNDTAEFVAQEMELSQRGAEEERHRQASLFMEHCMELANEFLQALGMGVAPTQPQTVPPMEESETLWV